MEWKFFWAKTFIDFLNLFHFSLTTTNESLEEKCEELRRQIEDLHREVEIERRKNERLQLEQRTKRDESVIAPANISSRKPDVSVEKCAPITFFRNYSKLYCCFPFSFVVEQKFEQRFTH